MLSGTPGGRAYGGHGGKRKSSQEDAIITMNSSSRNVEDPREIESLFNEWFAKNPVFLKTEEGNVEVHFVSCQGNEIRLRIPNGSILRKHSIVYATRETTLVSAHAELREREGTDEFLFSASHVQVYGIQRKEQRNPAQQTPGHREKSVYISSLISDFVLKDCFTREGRRTSAVGDSLQQKLNNNYEHVKVFLSYEKQYDDRMKMFLGKRKPVYIPNIKKDPETAEDKDLLKFYSLLITQDRKLNNSIISEIAVPFLYKGMIPFGYLQVNSSKELTPDDFGYLKKIGAAVSETFSANNIITTSDDIFNVSDLSRSGLSILFSEKTNIKHFKDGSNLFTRMFFPEGKTASMLCIVRNINMLKNNEFKIGCEILDMDALGQVYYDEFVEGLGNGS